MGIEKMIFLFLGLTFAAQKNGEECWDEASNEKYAGSYSSAGAFGKECISWTDERIKNVEEIFKRFADSRNFDHNSCRSNGEEKPWCYVKGMFSGVSREDCTIKLCLDDKDDGRFDGSFGNWDESTTLRTSTSTLGRHLSGSRDIRMQECCHIIFSLRLYSSSVFF